MSMSSITVIGLGAVGSAVAAALIESGHRPTMVTRTPFDHLRVVHPGGQVQSDVDVVTDPARLEPTDLVVLATKAHQTASAAEAMANATRPGTILIVAQNGIDHLTRLEPFAAAGALDGVTLIPSVVMLPADRRAPGRVRLTGAASLIVPRNEQTGGLPKLFEDSFLRIQLSDDWLTAAWTKLVANALIGAIGVLVRRENSFLEDPAAQSIAQRLIAEIVPVARAEGALLDDDLPRRLIPGILERSSGHLSSIVADRLRGDPTEWRERNEVIGRLGKVHGLATPLNDLLTTLIRLGEPDT